MEFDKLNNIRIPVGSRLLGLGDNNSDYDFFELSGVTYFEKLNRNSHIFHYSKSDFEKLLNIDCTNPDNIVVYQYDTSINKELSNYLDYSILDHRDSIIKCMKNCSEYLYREYITTEYINKRWYHIAYLYYIISNNNTTLDNDQLLVVKSIHDRVCYKKVIDKLYNDVMNLS